MNKPRRQLHNNGVPDSEAIRESIVAVTRLLLEDQNLSLAAAQSIANGAFISLGSSVQLHETHRGNEDVLASMVCQRNPGQELS